MYENEDTRNQNAEGETDEPSRPDDTIRRDDATNLSDAVDEAVDSAEVEAKDALGRDDLFDLLRNSRRREVLRYLRTQPDRRATVGEIAEHIAAKENGIDVNRLSSKQRKRVYIGLYQAHLPKLAELGVVEYDRNRGTATLLAIDQVEPYLFEESDEDVDRRPLYLVGGVILLVLAGVLGLGPLAAVPSVVWTIVSTAALGLFAGYQYLLRDE